MFTKIKNKTIHYFFNLRLGSFSQPQDQPVSNQLISSLQEEKYVCQKWFKLSCPRNESPRMAANVIRMQPGSTQMVVTLVQDIKSSFELFIPDTIQKCILDCTNLEGRRVFGERWKEIDQTHLHDFFGGSYPCWRFQIQWEIHRIPVRCRNWERTFPVQQCLCKTSTLFSGLSSLITETPDQLGGRETS